MKACQIDPGLRLQGSQSCDAVQRHKDGLPSAVPKTLATLAGQAFPQRCLELIKCARYGSKAFDYVVENHHVVDWAIPSIPHLDGVKAITDKIGNVTIDNDNATVQIPMTREMNG